MKIFLLLAVAALPLAAHAADTNDAAVSLTSACRKELRSTCKPKAGTSPLKCLQDHKADVSPACRKALDASKGAALPPSTAPAPGHASSCVPEFEKVCKGVKSKELGSCLKTHRAGLSEFCRKIADGLK